MRNYTIIESRGMRRLNTDDPVQRSYNCRVGAECPWSCTNVGQASMAGSDSVEEMLVSLDTEDTAI